MARNALVTIVLRAKNGASPVLAQVGKEFKTLGGSIKSWAGSVQGMMAGLGASITASLVVGFLVKVNREYGKLLTQLQTFEGSRGRALGVFKDLSKFAAETPFQIGELTEAYITLRSAGITPTMETMRLFGDQAAAFGGRINDFAEAVRAATTGEMERLKQFGVVARLQGDTIYATFNGQTKAIGRSAAELTKYLEELSRKNFSGGMERQARTLDGAISNLQDAFESLARGVGDAGLTDVLTKAAQAMTELVSGASQLAQLRVTFLEIQGTIMAVTTAVGLMLRTAITPVVMIIRTIPAILNTVLAAAALVLTPLAKGADVLTMGKFKFADKLMDAGIGRASAAGEGFKNAGKAFVGLGEAWGEGFAKLSLQEEAIAAAKADARSTVNVSTAGGLKKTGSATAPSNVFNPKEEKDAEAARKKKLDDLKDEADLLTEQIGLRKAGADWIQRSFELQSKLTAAMNGKGTAPGEKLALLKAAMGLGDARGGFFGNPMAMDATSVLSSRVPNLTVLSEEQVKAGQSVGQRIGGAMKDAIGDAQTLNQIIADMATNTLQGFGSAVESAFQALAEGSVSAGRAFASAMLGAIGEVASGLGQMALGKAGIAFGDALLGDPRGFAAAAKYLAAATGLFALAGFLKGKASQVSAGGARSGRGGANAANERLDKTSKGEATLVIEGGLLDLSDARQERAFKKALGTLSGRKIVVKKR